MQEIFKSEIGKYITVRKANVFRGRTGAVRVMAIRFCVDFCHYKHKRPSTIYCNNIAMGVYWHLFSLLSLSKACNVGIEKSEILALMKDCRRMLKLNY